MPVAGYAPLAYARQHPCAACCHGMHCGYDEAGNPVWPVRLSAIASAQGSCPEGGANTLVSATLSVFGDEWGDPPMSPGAGPFTCDDLDAAGCEFWDSFCVCYYAWIRPEAETPTCGPWISDIVLQCLPNGRHPDTVGCPHKSRHTDMWYGFFTVQRAVGLAADDVNCTIFVGGSPLQCLYKTCWVQDCADCNYKVMEFACDDVVNNDNSCCPTCPPCYDCTSHQTQRCAANAECCGSDGCNFCECPTSPPCFGDCDQCTHCIQHVPGSTYSVDPSCPVQCNGFSAIRYHFWHLFCDDPDEALGCNPVGCPKDVKDTGVFYLLLYCDDLDFLEIGCL